MLQSRPGNANAGALAQWDVTKKLTVELYERCWKIAEPNAPLFDDDATFSEWDDYVGMKKSNGKKHGVTRCVDGNYIEGYCYKDDRHHGLYIHWKSDGSLFAALRKNGSS